MSEAAILPIAEASPCGPDLDAEGDPDYLNCVARLQGEMPRSYLSYIYPVSEDDRVVIDFPRAFTGIAAFARRTHDLRLVVLRARLEILKLDLPAFSATVGLVAELLTAFWDEVHPRAEDGQMERRRIEIAALDEPTVIFALQYAPFYEDRRVGRISWRAYMYAQNKAKPRPGEKAPSESELIDTLRKADKAEIETARNSVVALVAAVTQIRTVWQQRVGESPPLDKLLELAVNIQGLIERAIPAPAPTLMERAATAIGGLLGTIAPADATPARSGIASAAEAGDALAAIARYFSRSEPSSPALPLIDQAASLRGKSFYEALQALLPKHAEQAAFKIGAQSTFELALSRAVKSEGSRRTDDEAADAAAGGAKAWAIESRQQALSAMGEVIAFYKQTEPSSPIPWLLERASELAERDFMSLLSDVLPKAALRDITQP